MNSTICGTPLSQSESNDATVAQQQAECFRRFADYPAVLTGEGWKSFADLERAAAQTAEHLYGRGVRCGDRVVLALHTTAESRIIEAAVLRAGFVRVALSPRLHVAEIARVAADAEASVVYCEPDVVDRLSLELSQLGVTADVITGAAVSFASDRGTDEAAPAFRPGGQSAEDAAMLIYTSGTTGSPKGAIVTHSAWIAQSQRSLCALPGIRNGDVVLAVAQTPYLGGSIALNCATAGAATVFMPHFDAAEVIAAVERHNVTVLPLAATMLELLTDELSASGRALPSLRAVPYGGSRIRDRSLADTAQLLPGVLIQFFGLAEALAPLTCLSPHDHDAAISPGASELVRGRLRSAGRWLSATEHRISDGELMLRGSTLTPGYWGASRLVTDSDGWFRTGDLATEDSDGYLHIADRADDVIISGGISIQPSEVERVLAALPGIDDVVVVGIPHPLWGEGVTAVVVLDPVSAARFDTVNGPGELLSRLATASAERLARYKKPVAVVVLPEIPRNPAGKHDRVRLRTQLSAAIPIHQPGR